MIAALIIVFREVIEVGLIVGILLAVTTGVARRGRWVAAGVAVGVGGATLVAIFIDALSGALAGVGQEVFNATILALAVVMLAWHNIWMSRHGRELAAQTKVIGEAVAAGSNICAGLTGLVASFPAVSPSTFLGACWLRNFRQIDIDVL